MTRTAPASSTSRAKSGAIALSLLAIAAALGGCSTDKNGLPDAGRLPTMRDAVKASSERFYQDAGPAGITRVRVPGSSMHARSTRPPVSSLTRARKIKISFQSQDAIVGDLVQAMSLSKIQVAFRWQNAKAEDVLKRRLPFTSYDGTVGELLDTLRTAIGLVSWQEGQTIFLSDAERYAIALPQNADILKDVATSLKDLGAYDIVTSLDGGKIIYNATPALQDEALGPFLDRTVRNLSTINLQVAVVSLALTDKTSNGFDWSKFSALVDGRQEAIDAANGVKSTDSNPGTNTGTDTGTGTGGGTGTGTGTGSEGDGLFPAVRTPGKGALVDITQQSLFLGATGVGKFLGVKAVGSVGGAIGLLSTFGNTNITQNLDLRTLSGKQVKFRSGQEIPYVKGVGVSSGGGSYGGSYGNGTNGDDGGAFDDNNSNSNFNNGNLNNSGLGSNGLLGSTQTDTVKTGLTVEMTPRFDADAQVVTVDIKMEMKSVIEFVELNAGNQIGKLTQPRTQEQELTDIVRMRAGQTVVIGGLQYDQEQLNGNELTVMRDYMRRNSQSFGKREQDVSRTALFIIMRPTVTVYQPSDVLSAEVSK